MCTWYIWLCHGAETKIIFVACPNCNLSRMICQFLGAGHLRFLRFAVWSSVGDWCDRLWTGHSGPPSAMWLPVMRSAVALFVPGVSNLKAKERERERGGKDIWRVDSKRKIKGWSERHFIFRGGRKSIILLEGSHATPARPSGRNNVKAKTLGW
jgi:hypothetical protein